MKLLLLLLMSSVISADTVNWATKHIETVEDFYVLDSTICSGWYNQTDKVNYVLYYNTNEPIVFDSTSTEFNTITMTSQFYISNKGERHVRYKLCIEYYSLIENDYFKAIYDSLVNETYNK